MSTKRRRLKRRFLAISVIALSILVASPTLASTDSQASAKYQAKYYFGKNQGGQAYAKPSVIGKVSAISGDSITVTDKNGVNYSVDATGAQIRKGFNQSSTLSSVAIGDTVLVQGTLAGSVVTATSIVDRKPGSTTGSHIKNAVQQHRMTGTLQSISGTSLTLLSAKGVTYTVDASVAKIVLGGGTRNSKIATSTVSSLQVNDKVMVSGTISTSTTPNVITAKMIRDTSRTS